MDLDRWLDEAWTRHAEAPAAVMADLAATGAGLAHDDAAVGRLLQLAQHVAGAHQGAPAELAAGRALLASLASLPAAGAAARASAGLCDRALALTGGDGSATAGLAVPEAVRAMALAAANLAEREPTRAGALLGQAVAAAEAAALSDTDPAVRALAVAGNNIAAALDEQPSLDPATRTLMLQAADVGLAFWRRAGTWLHEERAHYRLARAHRKAGDPARARQHAQACLALVAAHGDEALERFFGEEALGLAEAAAGDAAAHGRALVAARAAFGRLSAEDQSWCRPSLDGLAAALP
jgi:hypothetical protein